jgi:transcriptional antiterminator NusG
MKWYVIRTQSGHEQALKELIEESIRVRSLQDSFGEIIVPEIDFEEKKDGKKVSVRRNIYPGYLFLQMEYSDETWLLVKDTAFKKKPAFIGERRRFGKKGQLSKPTPIADHEIERIKKMIADGDVKIVSDLAFEKGEMVTIKDGPFSGFKAVVEDVKDGKEKLEVMVNIFGRSTPVELNYSQVEKEED